MGNYEQLTWVDYDPDYPLSAARMAHLDAGIDAAHTELDGRLSPENLGILSRAQAAGLVAPTYNRSRGWGLAVIGDSIAAYDIAVGRAWHKVFTVLSKKVRWRGVFALGGYTLEQIEANFIPSVLAMNPKPGACVVAGGTNNVGVDQAASKATLIRMVNTLQAAGIAPILWTLPPRNDSTQANTTVQKWNAWLRYFAQSKGLSFVDSYAALVDPATGLYKAGYNLDGTHPSIEGHYRIGKAAAADASLLAALSDDTPHLSRDILDAANLIPTGRGLFNQGVNGAGVPTGWGSYGFAAGNLVPSQAPGAEVGNWQILTRPAGGVASQGGLQYNVTAGFAVGDRLAFAARAKLTAADDGAHGHLSSSISARANNVTVPGPTFPTGGFGGTWEGILTGEIVVPATADTIRLDLSVSASTVPTSDVVAGFSQVTIVNLTQLGLA